MKRLFLKSRETLFLQHHYTCSGRFRLHCERDKLRGKMEGSVFPRESKFLYDAPRQEGKDLYCYESKLISNRCTGGSCVEEGNKDGRRIQLCSLMFPMSMLLGGVMLLLILCIRIVMTRVPFGERKDEMKQPRCSSHILNQEF